MTNEIRKANIRTIYFCHVTKTASSGEMALFEFCCKANYDQLERLRKGWPEFIDAFMEWQTVGETIFNEVR